MTSVAFVASVARDGQLVLELDVAAEDMSAPENAKPVLSRRVRSGAASLLRKLVAYGLDPRALQSAAALVAALDEELASGDPTDEPWHEGRQVAA
jgi:hypothetical protein